MINAKEELLLILKQVKYMHNEDIICGYVHTPGRDSSKLIERYTDDELDLFLSSIDFEYNNEYEAQSLYGCIWLTNGAWLQREKYNIGEEWKFYKCPTLPSKRIVSNF